MSLDEIKVLKNSSNSFLEKRGKFDEPNGVNEEIFDEISKEFNQMR